MAMALAVSMTACGNGSKSESSASSAGSQGSSSSSASQEGGNWRGHAHQGSATLESGRRKHEGPAEEAGYTVDLQYAANDIPTQVSQIENMTANWV